MKDKPNRRGPRRILAGLAVAAVLAMPMAPAHALDGPVAVNDYFEGTWTSTTSTVSGNVLENDTWDSSHTATLISVTLDGPSDAYPFTWTANGDITVDFGPLGDGSQPERYTSLIYTLRDSAGQEATGVVMVRQATPITTPIIARDDDLDAMALYDPPANDGSVPIEVGESWTTLQHLSNDSFGFSDDSIRVEIVSGPSIGTATAVGSGIRYTPPTPSAGDLVNRASSDFMTVRYTDSQDVTLRYRLCNASTCSAPARVDFRYVSTKTQRVPGAEVTRTFWDGSANEFDVNLRATAIAQGVPAATLDGATVGFETGGTPDGTELNGNTLTVRRSVLTPAMTSIGMSWSRRLVWRDADDVVVASLTVSAQYASAPTPPTVRNDTVWASVGQRVPISMLLNDTVRGDMSTEIVNPVGIPDRTDWVWRPYLLITDAPALVRNADRWDSRYDGYDNGARGVTYAAGNTAGTDRIKYKWCAGYPSEAGCSSEATITVRVSPKAAAADDKARTKAGTAVDIPVLDNDVFTDASGDDLPTPATATVQVTTVPKGVTATVNADRTVNVKAPKSMAGRTVSVGYTLRDYTGSASAVAKVKLTGADSPVAQAPKARDDEATGKATKPVKVNVLANDRFVGNAKVKVVNGSLPAGVKTSVDARGRVVVTVPKRLAGQRVTGTYRLTDRNGSDTARFSVTTMADSVTGADIETLDDTEPATTTASSGDTDGGGFPLLPVGLGAAALLGGAGLLAGRRRVA